MVKKSGMYVNPGRMADGFIYAPGKLLRGLLKKIRLVAAYDCPVLIEGESGTGKELVAKAIHFHSERQGKPLISLNCATLNNDLFCSQLFGHLKGAFTGAYSQQTGLIKAAGGGTLFLDEVSSLNLPAQAQLLRFLESGEVRALGAATCSYEDVRIIAASNVPLPQLCREGKFRLDLFYRLNVYPVQTVPLRLEPQSIGRFANLFLEEYSEKYGKNKRFCQDVLTFLSRCEWPGNVRELKAKVLKGLINSSNEKTIRLRHLGLDSSVSAELTVSLERDWDTLFAEVESHYLIHQLKKHHGNQQRLIEVSQKSKNYLRGRLRAYRINPRLFARARYEQI